MVGAASDRTVWLLSKYHERMIEGPSGVFVTELQKVPSGKWLISKRFQAFNAQNTRKPHSPGPIGRSLVIDLPVP